MGRDALRLRRAKARRGGHRRGDRRLLPREHGALQGAADGDLRRPAQDLHGQGPEVRPPRPGEGGVTMAATAGTGRSAGVPPARSEEHTSELQSLMRISYAVFCLKKKMRSTHTTSCNRNTHEN